MTSVNSAIRIDKWLWFARFFRSRSLAGKVCLSGRIRVDGVLVEKAHYNIRIGQVVTFPQAHRIRVVKVLQLGLRRGPAAEAAGLYQNMSDETTRVPRIRAVSPKPVNKWYKHERNKDVW